MREPFEASRLLRNENAYGAQPPRSPSCAGFAHNGVEMPPAAGNVVEVSDDASATKVWRFVTGHEFTHAETFKKKFGALAPAN